MRSCHTRPAEQLLVSVKLSRHQFNGMKSKQASKKRNSTAKGGSTSRSKDRQTPLLHAALVLLAALDLALLPPVQANPRRVTHSTSKRKVIQVPPS